MRHHVRASLSAWVLYIACASTALAQDRRPPTLDDLLNLVPARLAALAIVGSALVAGEDGRGAWRVMLRDRARTASPNAGWTMAAMAGALGVVLEKPGAYRLGSGRAPESRDIIRAIGVSMTAALSVVVAAVAALILRNYWG